MKKLARFFVFALVFCVLLNFVNASFEVGNVSHLIDNQYGSGSFVKGWVNISFSDEPANFLVASSNGNSLSLIDLINTNPDFNYSCNVENCEADYSATKPETAKTLVINSGQSKFLGFQFTGQIASIDLINFTFLSNAPPGCSDQIELDFLNDGVKDLGNVNPSDQICGTYFGCFNDNNALEEYFLDVVPYCQKITLPESPGFILGAWVKKGTKPNNLSMLLYDGGRKVSECTLPNPSGFGSKISCKVNYFVKEQKDYYVCISSNVSWDDSKVRGYSATSGCGFFGFPIQQGVAAYDIFAEKLGFGNVGLVSIENLLPSGESLSVLASNYIKMKYGSLDCTNRCIVPMKFTSHANQVVNIADLELLYRKSSGRTVDNKFYDVAESPAKISSDFQKLYLDKGNFSVPEVFGNTNFTLKLNGAEIFTEQISVERVPEILSLTPANVPAAYPTEFNLLIDYHNSTSGIVEYVWKFGDNSTITTTTNRATHVYRSIGNFTLEVSIKDSNNFFSSKNFEISVESPKVLAGTLLEEGLANFNNLDLQLNNLSLFYRDSLEEALGFQKIEENLTEIQALNASANSDFAYIKIVESLVELNIPRSIRVSMGANSLTFYPLNEEINLDVLKEIAEGDYTDSEKFKNSIISWNAVNLDTKISFKEFSVTYDDSEIPLLNFFELKTNRKSQDDTDVYFILKDLGDLRFAQDYSFLNNSGYFYKTLSFPDTLIFSTANNVDFTNLPVFVSPGLNAFSVVPSDQGGMPKWVILVIVIVCLFVLGIGLYLFLHRWYKNKYENYLFKNKNELYNLVSYISNEEQKRTEKSEVISNLKKADWSSEQINYVMNKYMGKRTGMFDIPFGKFFRRQNRDSVPQKKHLR